MRLTMSSTRTARASLAATILSSSSPVSWPWVSLFEAVQIEVEHRDRMALRLCLDHDVIQPTAKEAPIRQQGQPVVQGRVASSQLFGARLRQCFPGMDHFRLVRSAAAEFTDQRGVQVVERGQAIGQPGAGLSGLVGPLRVGCGGEPRCHFQPRCFFHRAQQAVPVFEGRLGSVH
jgi:hypothetical protein